MGMRSCAVARGSAAHELMGVMREASETSERLRGPHGDWESVSGVAHNGMSGREAGDRAVCEGSRVGKAPRCVSSISGGIVSALGGERLPLKQRKVWGVLEWLF